MSPATSPEWERPAPKSDIPFKVVAAYEPTGDQPLAIERLARGLKEGFKHQTLLGVTGSGKTFTMAKVIERVQRPTLVLAHNKTLAAQLYSEFKEFFPNNAVEYFVSYYDYYQPEAYIARSDTYIEKESEVNEEIDRLRHAATRALFERRDTIIVASVSCIYGIGAPEEYGKTVVSLRKGGTVRRERVLRHLIDIQYERNDSTLVRGSFRVRGDTLEIFPAYEEIAMRIELWGDEIERITTVDPLTGEVLGEHTATDIYPAKHFVTSQEKLQAAMRDIEEEMIAQVKLFEAQGKLIEAQRIKQRTMYDLEMLSEVGYCAGIENYSRPLARRPPGSQPLDAARLLPGRLSALRGRVPHLAPPGARACTVATVRARSNSCSTAFRLPSALDNRPLMFDEFERHLNQTLYVSATPADYEMQRTRETGASVVEQIIRPTGLLDPVIHVRPTDGQIDDLLEEVRVRVAKGQRVLITTLTKRMAEDLTDYLKEMGVKTQYLHHDIETLERIDILRSLRLGVYDAVVGINLLREGLDLPEVSLVAILDADKEGFLRSGRSLVQIIGRAARHIDGTVVMYADKRTDSMNFAISETERRRTIQDAYNKEHGITPRGIVKEIRDLTDRVKAVAAEKGLVTEDGVIADVPKEELTRMVKDLEGQMKLAAKNLDFERATLLRDQVVELRRLLIE